jgi:hypothetical protein
MKQITPFLLLITSVVICTSCKNDPEPYAYKNSNGWTYYDGDANVKDYNNVEIDFDIKDNLNVDGSAIITSDLSIKNDLNLNANGKVIINTEFEDDTVRINGNMNLNDSLNIYQGIVLLYGNLNINSNGIVNIKDGASLKVYKDVNHNGTLYGNRNLTVQGTFHNNGGSSTFAAPITTK